MPDIVWAQKMKSWRRKVRLSAAMCWTSSQRWSWFSAFWLGRMHLQPVKKVLHMQAFTLELSCMLWFQWWSGWKSQLSDQGFLWESWMHAGAQRGWEKQSCNREKSNGSSWRLLTSDHFFTTWGISLQPPPNKHWYPTCLPLQTPGGNLGWSPLWADVFSSPLLPHHKWP